MEFGPKLDLKPQEITNVTVRADLSQPPLKYDNFARFVVDLVSLNRTEGVGAELGGYGASVHDREKRRGLC